MLAGMMLVGARGCHMILPDVCHQPVVHNPFPQLQPRGGRAVLQSER